MKRDSEYPAYIPCRFTKEQAQALADYAKRKEISTSEAIRHLIFKGMTSSPMLARDGEEDARYAK